MNYFLDPERQSKNYPVDPVLRDTASAIWLWRDASLKVKRMCDLAAVKGEMTVFVIFNGPTNSGWGSGIIDHKNMVENIGNAIGTRPATVVIEPDSLPLSLEWTVAERDARIKTISEAVQVLSWRKNIQLYLDAGHATWRSENDMAVLLSRAGIAQCTGFTLNVSNFRTNGESLVYGNKLSALVGGKKFLIDTARNGNGPHPNNEWCNPRGRALGTLTTNTDSNLLWLKPPGESDGTCNGGPTPGIFWVEYANELVANWKANQVGIPPSPPSGLTDAQKAIVSDALKNIGESIEDLKKLL